MTYKQGFELGLTASDGPSTIAYLEMQTVILGLASRAKTIGSLMPGALPQPFLRPFAWYLTQKLT